MYTTPALGGFLPSKKVTLHYAANLHLMPDGGEGESEKEEEQKLYVTRVTDLARHERFPLESFVYVPACLLVRSLAHSLTPAARSS